MKVKWQILAFFFCITFSIMAQESNIIKHTVTPGQTLYFISKKYNLSVEQLKMLNPDIGADLIIRPGQVLTIKTSKAPVKVDNNNFKLHTVQTKETLYSISKKYGITVDELITINHLNKPDIKVGQELRVKKLKVNHQSVYSNTPKEISKVEIQRTESNIKPSKEVKHLPEDVVLNKQLFDSYNAKGNVLRKDKGMGNYLNSGQESYLAMVNNVPSGQIVKVRNLMNNKVIYLKVIGGVPESDAVNNISIKISKAAAEELNVLEDRFLAEWMWYKLINTQDNKQVADF